MIHFSNAKPFSFRSIFIVYSNITNKKKRYILTNIEELPFTALLPSNSSFLK